MFRSALLTVHNKWKSTYAHSLGAAKTILHAVRHRSNRFIERAQPFSSTFPFSSRSYFWALALFSLSGTLIATIGITVMVNPNRFRRFFLGYCAACTWPPLKTSLGWLFAVAIPSIRQLTSRSQPILLPHLCSIPFVRFDSFILSSRKVGTDELLHFVLFHVCRTTNARHQWAFSRLIPLFHLQMKWKFVCNADTLHDISHIQYTSCTSIDVGAFGFSFVPHIMCAMPWPTAGIVACEKIESGLSVRRLFYAIKSIFELWWGEMHGTQRKY